MANALTRRTDTVWVDILGGGDEISAVFFLDGPDARNTLLLRDLPATDAVRSWTAHTLLRVFPAVFRWTAGLLSAEETAQLSLDPPAAAPAPRHEAARSSSLRKPPRAGRQVIRWARSTAGRCVRGGARSRERCGRQPSSWRASDLALLWSVSLQRPGDVGMGLGKLDRDIGLQ
ncbi:hypothetical protein [Dactylosporangium salmoneum]|uniref:hypothetical protein n=1 Tax=Dactylosporangium salmoneum TaxID=53361 RepID=UPI0031CFAFC0